MASLTVTKRGGTEALTTNRRPIRWRAAALAITAGWFLALIAWVPPALAHTAFESSQPEDGSTVDVPVSEIAITFTGAAEPAGEGFVVLTPAGVIIEPDIDLSADQRTFTLKLDEALVDGTVGVRWSVRAGDAHPIEGSFSFTTTAPVPTVIPLPTATATATPEPTQPPADSFDSSDRSTAPVPDDPAEPDDPTPAPVQEPAGEAAAPTSQDPAASSASSPAPIELDTFLDANAGDGISASDVVGFGGRALTLAAALVAVGVTLLTLVLAPSVVGQLHSTRWIGALAAVLAVGVLAEGGAFVIDGAGSVLGGQTGVALGLRLAGAIAIAAGSLRKMPPIQLLGAAALLGSFVFDGHTVTEGNRYVTAATDIVHAGAASIWIGGIVILLVLRYSTAEGSDRRFTDFAARFSVIATFSIGVVGAAGIVLTATIVESVSDIWSTDWGQILIAKSGVVAVAMALGAYNHFTLVPAMRRDDAGAAARLGKVLRVEVILLLAVAVLTALLVVGQT